MPDIFHRIGDIGTLSGQGRQQQPLISFAGDAPDVDLSATLPLDILDATRIPTPGAGGVAADPAAAARASLLAGGVPSGIEAPVEETPNRFRDFILRAGGGRPSLLNTLSAAFGQGTEEIAARKRADLLGRLEEAETRARIRTLNAPPVASETFEPVFDASGNIVGQRSSTTRRVVTDPRTVAPTEPAETFEPVLDPETGNIIGQRNLATGQVTSDPRATVLETRRVAAETAEIETQERSTRAQNNIANIDRTIGVIQRLKDHPGGSRAIGFESAFPSVPGSAASDFKAVVDTALARLGFEELARMRANSPTGGALGQIAVRELDFLQAAEQSLSLSQSDKQFFENLVLIEESLGRFRAVQEQFLTTGNEDIPVVTNQAEFDALPSGAFFIEDGQQFRKP